jgi:trigger factor
MADEATAVADEKETFEYPVKVEDAGPATKKVTVEVPRQRIDEELAKQFKDIRQQAAIPGFRPGHAPAKLVEKRFSNDVKEQVRRSLLQESYQQAIEKHSLQVLGDPEFDDADKIQLPDSGSMNYSFQVEVQPDIKLPELKGLKVKKPKIDVTDDNVQQAMNNLLEQQGTLIPVEDRGVQEKDYLVADVHVKLGDKVITHQHDAQLVSRPGRIAGIQVEDLARQLEGLKGGEKRNVKAKASDTHANEEIRGKDVEIEIALKDIKRMELAELTAEFLSNLGFKDESELRDALRKQMEERLNFDVQQTMREQVSKYLLESVQIDLPNKLSASQTERIISRRAVDLMMRGMPRDQVEANIEQLRGGAKDEAARELKLFFILQKIATEQNVEVSEAELNGRIAMLAAQRGRRPEKVKQDMAKDGSLANLYVQMREQKAVDQILSTAEIEEVMPEEKKD